LGTNIPDTTGHQMAIQVPTSPNICFYISADIMAPRGRYKAGQRVPSQTDRQTDDIIMPIDDTRRQV